MDVNTVAATAVLRHFGPLEHIVASELLARGGASSEEELFGWVATVRDKEQPAKSTASPKLDAARIREAMALLAQNGIVYRTSDQKIHAHRGAMTRRWLFPFYSVMVAELYGVEAQRIVELFLARGRVSSRALFATEEDESRREQRKLTAQKLIREGLVVWTETSAPLKMGKEPPASVPKRKRVRYEDEVMKARKGEEEDKQTAPPEKPDSVWGLGFDQLHRLVACQICKDLARTSIDDDAARIVDILLQKTYLSTHTNTGAADLGDPGGYSMGEDRNPALGPVTSLESSALFNELQKGSQPMSYSLYEERVQLMLRPDFGYVSRWGNEFAPDVDRMLATVKQSTAEDIILKRFGAEARRVFRLLVYKKKLESRQVSEYSMLPQKKAREVLFNLYEHGYATVQEIPRSTDFKQSRCFYIWSINMPEVFRYVAEHLDRTCLNLYRRLEQMGGGREDGMGGDLAQKRMDLIEHSLVRLHKSLLLFREL